MKAARAVLPPYERAAVVAAGAEGQPAEVDPRSTWTATPRPTRGGLTRSTGRTVRCGPWSSMAVLYHVNAQSAPFEEALRRAGVPYHVRGAAAFPRPARGESRHGSAAQERQGGARTARSPSTSPTWSATPTSCRRIGREHIDAVRGTGEGVPRRGRQRRFGHRVRGVRARRCGVATTAGSPTTQWTC